MKRFYTEETREQIIRNPLNDSTSKTSFSFSKDARFKTQKHICPHVAYDINLNTTSKRKTTFGYGKRTSFILNNQFTPAPVTYSLELSKEKRNRNCSFGANRQQAISSSYIPLGRLRNPGPSHYQQSTSRQSSNKNRGYSLRPKTAHERTYFIENKQLEQRPGPGNYQINGTMIERDSTNVYSKFKHLGVPYFDARTSKRFSEFNKNPGPGTYLNKTGFEGDSTISKNKSIGRQTRTSFIQSAKKGSYTPGPGTYKLPTDFAHYTNILGMV